MRSGQATLSQWDVEAKPSKRPNGKTRTLKNQMRSIQRSLLNTKSRMRPSERVRLQRKFERINASQSKRLERLTIQKMAKRYKEIRFIEKKKVMRLMKRARKIKNAKNRTLELKKAEEMLDYIYHYPPEKKYISLFRNYNMSDPKYAGQQRKLERDRARIMNQTKALVRSLSVVTDLDEGFKNRSMAEFQKEIVAEERAKGNLAFIS
mmetsp:Transcript_8005/g.11346  ORF Transcript_8005/g.11346 Transcript_8005/m.11346 type:complete len:207 (+) Transcript_8005:349-969(+)